MRNWQTSKGCLSPILILSSSLRETKCTAVENSRENCDFVLTCVTRRKKRVKSWCIGPIREHYEERRIFA